MTSSGLHDLSDIKQNDWVERWFSPALTPYFRLARLDGVVSENGK
ncbi:hypothetical protein AB6866_07425 [Rahnella inusitata]